VTSPTLHSRTIGASARLPLGEGTDETVMSPHDSAQAVIARLRAGDDAAAAEVFDRFAGRLIDLARAHLSDELRAKIEPEDVLQSVFRSFFARHRAGRFALSGWDDVWGLLTVITLRKCRNQAAYFCAGRRDVGRESARTDNGSWPAATALSRDPTPSEAAVFADLLAELTRRLDDRDKQVLELHLHGHAAPEIAARIGRAVRTVWRSLERIRARAEELQPPVDHPTL
jgi:RNA polymerase sigma-70 factor (ECF subfamily)